MQNFKRFWLEVDRVLRGSPKTGVERLPLLLGFIFLGGFIYGAVMGSFGGLAGDRVWLVIYSGLKVPLLLVSFFVALPSFFVLNTLLGLRFSIVRTVRSAGTCWPLSAAFVQAGVYRYPSPAKQLFGLASLSLAILHCHFSLKLPSAKSRQLPRRRKNRFLHGFGQFCQRSSSMNECLQVSLPLSRFYQTPPRFKVDQFQPAA